MYYSSYRNLLIGISIAVIVGVGLLIAIVGGWAAFVIVPALALFVALGCWFSLAWMQRAMANFDGAPFPGLFGLMGVDVVPDGTDLQEHYDPAPDYDSNELPPPETTPTVVNRGCPKCGAITQGQDAKVCRVCGAPLSP